MSHVLRVNVWNKYNQQMENIYNTRKKLKNILSYVDFEKLCVVIKIFLSPFNGY